MKKLTAMALALTMSYGAMGCGAVEEEVGQTENALKTNEGLAEVEAVSSKKFFDFQVTSWWFVYGGTGRATCDTAFTTIATKFCQAPLNGSYKTATLVTKEPGRGCYSSKGVLQKTYNVLCSK